MPRSCHPSCLGLLINSLGQTCARSGVGILLTGVAGAGAPRAHPGLGAAAEVSTRDDVRSIPQSNFQAHLRYFLTGLLSAGQSGGLALVVWLIVPMHERYVQRGDHCTEPGGPTR